MLKLDPTEVNVPRPSANERQAEARSCEVFWPMSQISARKRPSRRAWGLGTAAERCRIEYLTFALVLLEFDVLRIDVTACTSEKLRSEARSDAFLEALRSRLLRMAMCSRSPRQL